jgi:DNA polymerase iota
VRSIVHVDANCFYCQVEAQRRPELQGRPIAVRQKTILVSTSYEARALGVGKMSSLAEALAACPSLVIVNGENLVQPRC